MLDRTIAPPVQELKSFQIPKAVSGQLSNGIPIHYIRAGSQPLLKLEIIFDAGTYFEPKPCVAFFSSKMLSEGTTKLSARQIADSVAKYGAHLEVETGNDKVVVVLITLSKYLSHILPVVDDIIHDATFAAKSFESIKHIYLQQLRINLEKTGYVATGLFRKNIFGENHPYGYYTSETTLDSIKISDCLGYYNSFFKDNAFEIVISGMVNDATIQEIDQVLGQRKYKRSQLHQPLVKELRPERDQKVTVNKEGAVQSTIRIGKKLFTRNHPDYLKFTVLNEVLGGYFGSRLMKNVREEKGLTYGIHSQAVTLLNEGYFVIGTDVKKDLVSKALEEIYIEIERLVTTPIPEEELRTVKNYMIGTFMGSITTPFSLANKFKAMHFNGLSATYYDEYVANINKIKAEDLQKLADKYFDKSGFSEVIVG